MEELRAQHMLVEYVRVSTDLITKPDKEPLLLRPTDPVFVDELAVGMAGNPAAIVAAWLCVVVCPRGK